jgi:hypothetical protein
LDILGCVNPDVKVTNWNDNVVPTAIVMVSVLAMVVSLGNTYLAICNGNYYSSYLGNDRLASNKDCAILMEDQHHALKTYYLNNKMKYKGRLKYHTSC